MLFFISHRQVSLNSSGRSTNQMMLLNRMLSYQAKLQNCHEFILSNLISDSDFSSNSKFYGRVSKKQKAENWSSIDDGQGRTNIKSVIGVSMIWLIIVVILCGLP